MRPLPSLRTLSFDSMSRSTVEIKSWKTKSTSDCVAHPLPVTLNACSTYQNSLRLWRLIQEDSPHLAEWHIHSLSLSMPAVHIAPVNDSKNNSHNNDDHVDDHDNDDNSNSHGDNDNNNKKTKSAWQHQLLVFGRSPSKQSPK